MKKKIFYFVLSAFLIISISTTVLAASGQYKYSNGYIMNYKLYAATISGSSGAAAETDTEYEARAFVSIFGYDKNGVVKNSGSKTQDFYVYLGIVGNGSKTFKSYHSLLDENSKPFGVSQTLSY